MTISRLLAIAAIAAASLPQSYATGPRFGGAPWAARRGRKRWKHARRCR